MDHEDEAVRKHEQNPADPDSPKDRRKAQQIPREEVRPILEELRTMIRRSEYSQRQVEEMTGFSRGYLSQLLAQNLDLKVWHLIAILDLFKEHPRDFFARIEPRRESLGLDSRRGALSDFVASSQPIDGDLAASFDRLYQLGADSLVLLRRRLARYDEAVDELEARGLVGKSAAAKTK